MKKIYPHILIAIVLSACTNTPVKSHYETNGRFPFCHRYGDLEEIWAALSKDDKLQVRALLQSKACFYPAKKLKLSVIDRIGVIDKVRLYIGDKSMVLYGADMGYN